LTDGLGGAVELVLLHLRPSHWPIRDSRDTFEFDCISQPQCARTHPSLALAWRTAFRVACCSWRAARRRTGSHHKAHALAEQLAKDGRANRGGGSMQPRLSGVRPGLGRHRNGCGLPREWQLDWRHVLLPAIGFRHL